MITATMSVRVNRPQIRAELGRAGIKFINRVTEAIAIKAREFAPKDSGNLRSSVRSEPARMAGPTRVTGRVVALARYAVWQHEGTGIYGPRRTPIRPRRARYLRFYWKKVGAVVFRKSVRGTKPTKYLTRALDEVLSTPPWKIVYFTPVR